jgi:hypothetical protein
MRRVVTALLLSHLILFLTAASLWGQQRVSPKHTYERLIAIVPMIGTGTDEDPRRPQFVPAQGVDPSRRGLIGVSYQLSDDENFALVEFVARDRSVFKEILAEAKNGLQVFEKGKGRKADLALAWRLHKSEFNLENLGVSLP